MSLLLSAFATASIVVTPLQRASIELRGGDAQAFELELAQDQAVFGTVLQRGIDLALAWIDPDGKTLIEVDSPNGANGPEPVAFVAPGSGRYRLEVKALDPRAAAGLYDVSLEAVRAATPRDRDLASALGLQQRAQAWRDEALALRSRAEGERSRALYAQALAAASEALEQRRRVLGPEHPDLVPTLALLGYIDDEIGEYARGQQDFERALAIQERGLGRGHADLLVVQSDLGYLQLAAGHLAEAVETFRFTAARYAEVEGPTSRRATERLLALGSALFERGDVQEAELALRRGLALRQTSGASAQGFWQYLGAVAVADGRLDDAITACAALRRLAEAAPAAPRGSMAAVLQCEAGAELLAGRATTAAPLAAEALAIREAAVGPSHPWVAEALLLQGRVALAQGELVAAGSALERGAAIATERLGPEHPTLAALLQAQGDLFLKQADPRRAAASYRRAIGIFEARVSPTHAGLERCRAGLEAALRQGA